jgi:DNA modification methylase
MTSDTKVAGEVSVAYETELGVMLRGNAEDAFLSSVLEEVAGNVQLILTSPPFPLNRKKKYGNRKGAAYVDWLAGFAPLFRKLLKRNGSIVIEMGNAWEPGRPVMSTLALEALLAFLKRGDLLLCQQFVCHNPARLPSPAQWVNVERIRVKDSFTHIWWMSRSARPKASNRRVLKEYSPAMKRLLASKRYNSGKRPSEHNIGATSFLKRNGGAIPSNVLQFANTATNDDYQRYCHKRNLPPHPARMPSGLAEFFIKFLTQPGDLVLDPFAGSNVTGATAQRLNRTWVSIEPNKDYVDGSVGRFPEGVGL